MREGPSYLSGVDTLIQQVEEIPPPISPPSLQTFTIPPDCKPVYFDLESTGLGFGGGMMYMSGVVCVSEYFDKRRALATGFIVSGTGLGSFIFSPLTAVLIETYTWRGALLIQAGLLLNCLACSLLFKPLSHNNNIQPEGNELLNSYHSNTNTEHSAKDSDEKVTSNTAEDIGHPGHQADTETNTNNVIVHTITAECNICHGDSCQQNKHFSLKTVCSGIFRETFSSFRDSMSPLQFRNTSFALFSPSAFILNLGYYTPYVYLPVKSRDVGLGEIEAAWILSTMAITSKVSRIVFGFISDRKWVNRLYLYSTALVLCGIATSLGPFYNSIASLLIYAVVFGIFSAVIMTLLSVLIADIAGIDNLSRAFGMVNFVSGIAILIGPPIGVAFYIGPSGKLTFDEAVSLCAQESTTVASKTDLLHARSLGYQKCQCGWLSDETNGFVMQQSSSGCGGTFNLCGRVTTDVYCRLPEYVYPSS